MSREVLIERPAVTIEFESEVIQAPNLVVVRAGACLGLGCGQCILHRRLLTNGELQIFRSNAATIQPWGKTRRVIVALTGRFSQHEKRAGYHKSRFFCAGKRIFRRKNPQTRTFLTQFKRVYPWTGEKEMKKTLL